jgi:4a-hydroxytetrahydrobiopterin dehydratase
MATPVTAAELASLDLPDWRWILGTIEARFGPRSPAPTDSAGPFTAAARFVAQVAELADEADHHPDIDLRYPGVVRITLVTHADGTVTDLDVALAAQISAAAAEAGLPPQPRASQGIEIAIDALDIALVLPFWQAVLGYAPVPGAADDAPACLVDPARVGPAVWFQQMDEPRPQRNRIHLDISVPHDEVDERLAAALAAGGILVSEARARAFWVLADAEGNEACLCTWQDRD